MLVAGRGHLLGINRLSPVVGLWLHHLRLWCLSGFEAAVERLHLQLLRDGRGQLQIPVGAHVDRHEVGVLALFAPTRLGKALNALATGNSVEFVGHRRNGLRGFD